MKCFKTNSLKRLPDECFWNSRKSSRFNLTFAKAKFEYLWFRYFWSKCHIGMILLLLCECFRIWVLLIYLLFFRCLFIMLRNNWRLMKNDVIFPHKVRVVLGLHISCNISIWKIHYLHGEDAKRGRDMFRNVWALGIYSLRKTILLDFLNVENP